MTLIKEGVELNKAIQSWLPSLFIAPSHFHEKDEEEKIRQMTA